MGMSSGQQQQGIADGDGITLLDVDCGDLTGPVGADFGFHLHGFEDHQGVSGLHVLADTDHDLEDVARQRRRSTSTYPQRAQNRCRRRWRATSSRLWSVLANACNPETPW